MADKFPLVVDGTAIKELPNGDNLELTGSNVVGAGTVALTNLTVSGSQGNDGQVLTSTGSGIAWENAPVSTSALPKTGGAMTGAITTNSTFDGRDVGTDGTKLDGIEASADVTDAANVTAAGALMDSELASIASIKALNQGVATADSPTFAGVTTSGITNTANLKISGAQGTDGQILTSTGSGVAWEDAAGGGGAWNVISSQTVSSSVAYVTFTGMTGYENYKLVWNNVVHSGQQTYIAIQVSTDGGTNFNSSGWEMFNRYFNTQSTSLNVDIHNGSEGYYWVTDAGQINQYNTNQKHAGEVMFWAFNASNYTYARSLSLADKSNEYIGVNEAFGQLRQNTGYNALRFRAGANFTGGTFTLYGLSNS